MLTAYTTRSRIYIEYFNKHILRWTTNVQITGWDIKETILVTCRMTVSIITMSCSDTQTLNTK